MTVMQNELEPSIIQKAITETSVNGYQAAQKVVETVTKDGPHISIKPEHIFDFFGLAVTNSLLTSWIVVAFLVLLALLYQRKKGTYQVINLILKPIYNLLQPIFRNKIELFFPIIMTFFFYILFLNWFGLFPGVGSILFGPEGHQAPLFRAGTADLNTTLAFGFLSVLLVQFYSIKYLGIKKYISKFINLTNPINAFVGILEIISEISKAISFSFRLFGNIFAGEVLLTIIPFLLPIFFTFISFPFMLFEIFVGLIQALVFSMLSAIFISVATTEHGH